MAKSRMHLIKGDITQLTVDAIVNAANEQLRRGSGVCGAIHQAAGPELQKECQQLGGCLTGEAKLTHGYRLPAKYVIQTVGPIWHGGQQGEPSLLANCYQNTLALVVKKDIKSVAFPAISCGVYGYPANQAAMIAVKETLAFLKAHPQINEVIFVCFDDNIYEAYQTALEKIHE